MTGAIVTVNRRTVLQAGGVIAAAGVVAACGSGSEAPAAVEPEATTDSGDGSSEVTSPSAPLASTEDIPVGGGVIIDEPAIVITHPADGDYKAFTAICPHQGCLVSEVSDNQVLCPCHGSLFSAEDGSVLAGPARQGLTPAGIVVDGGSIVLG